MQEQAKSQSNFNLPRRHSQTYDQNNTYLNNEKNNNNYSNHTYDETLQKQKQKQKQKEKQTNDHSNTAPPTPYLTPHQKSCVSKKYVTTNQHSPLQLSSAQQLQSQQPNHQTSKNKSHKNNNNNNNTANNKIKNTNNSESPLIVGNTAFQLISKNNINHIDLNDHKIQTQNEKNRVRFEEIERKHSYSNQSRS